MGRIDSMQCLHDEMYKRGLNKAQVESKAVSVVLSILANTDEFDAVGVARAECARLEKEISNQRRILEVLKGDIAELAETAKTLRNEIYENISSVAKRDREYIERFFEEVNNAETSEVRDKIRIAQLFMNSVDVDTKYDNTAFIVGLSNILVGTHFDAIDELRRINKRLPNIKVGNHEFI